MYVCMYVCMYSDDKRGDLGLSYQLHYSDLIRCICQFHKMASKRTLQSFRQITIQKMFIVLWRILILQLLFYWVSTFFNSCGKKISISTDGKIREKLL